MDVDLRTCNRDELPQFLKTLETAFGHEISDANVKRHLKVMDPERMHAAFDGETMVGTAGVYPFTFTVPGAQIPAAGVTMVGVMPSHTRRGILRRLMRVQMDDAHERGESIAVLWASEDVIYQRFGYGMASLQAQFDLSRDHAGFLRDAPRAGRIRLVDAEEAVKVLPGVYDRVAETTPGMFARSAEWWRYHRLFDIEENRHGGGPLWRAVLDIDGRAEAYALYRVFSKWEEGVNTGHTQVEEAMATSPDSMREIWRFLIGVDLMQHVKGWLLPADHPLLLSVAEPTRLRFMQVDSLWLRVVDVAAALEARAYSMDGALVIEVADDFCEWNAGRWLIEVTSGKARVEKTTEEPDVTLGAAELAVVYLSGFTFTHLESAGRITARERDALRRADAMFHWPVSPWCPEIF